MKKIQIKISNRGIYTIIAAVIILVTAIVVNAWAPPPVWHSEDELDLGNYYNKTEVYTKGEVDGIIADITGTCTWTGWNVELCPSGPRCIVPDCNLPINVCACDVESPGYSIDCCTSWGNYRCEGDYVEAYECTNGVITDHQYMYANCRMDSDPTCSNFPLY